MLKADVKLKGLYTAKVSGSRTQVRISSEHPAGGWFAENQKTGRLVRIRTAARLTNDVAELTARQEAFERRVQQARDRVAYRNFDRPEE